MRHFILLIFFMVISFGATVFNKEWQIGDTFLDYLQDKNISLSLYYNLDTESKELLSEIVAGIIYEELISAKGELEQVLIPISDELQAHIYKDWKSNKYKFDFLPIYYQEKSDKFVISVKSSPYKDIIKETGDIKLAHEFLSAFRYSVDFTRLQKGDKVAIIYDEKVRLGKIFGSPNMRVAMVEVNSKPNWVFKYSDGAYYNEKGKKTKVKFLQRPLKNARITSKFTLRRWHPILKRYRAHLGVDFGARCGTPIQSAGDGVIVFRGRKGGYGNTIIINHGGGYRTLYAHMSRFRGGFKSGSRVKQGQIIGYVGSTGMSTGPHLHFGLYKNGRAINPLSVIKIATGGLRGKDRKLFKKMVKRYQNEIKRLIEIKQRPTLYFKGANYNCCSLELDNKIDTKGFIYVKD